jgi:predicted Zn-ribbon and HTH transcriptional regulator
LTISIADLILTYVVVLLAALAGASIYSELRRRSFQPTPSEDRIFRCGRCGYVYTDDPDVDRSRCSQCGQLNKAIEF